MEDRDHSEAGPVLGRAFFVRSTLAVARDLIGCRLHVEPAGGEPLVGRIVETEGYLGREDPASHAAGGPTPRSAIMYGEPAIVYVYLIYGLHHCLNLVTGPEGSAGAVLIRALEPERGRPAMVRRCGPARRPADRELTGGPGRLCRACGIDLAWNGLPAGAVAPPGGPGRLWVSARRGPEPRILAGGRIGVRRGGELPYRFVDADSPCLSRPPVPLR